MDLTGFLIVTGVVLATALAIRHFGRDIRERVGRKLIEGVRNPTVVEDASALEDFAVAPRGMAESIRRALDNEDREFASTRWADANGNASKRPRRYGRRIVDIQTVRVNAPPAEAFGPVARRPTIRPTSWGSRI